jgi:two-component system chemotaxis response regulator CheB
LDTLRVLVVDDTIVYRKIVSDVLAEIPGVTVVGTANNGKIALSRILSLKPDLITLDVEMPEMNGLEVLELIRKDNIATEVVMLSNLTVKGGELTIKALELGALDRKSVV